MPRAYRLGDRCTGHGRRKPTATVESSGDVFINAAGAARQGDALEPHGCRSARVITGGSGTVFINGKPAARSGDAISCGGTAGEGSQNVWIGD